MKSKIFKAISVFLIGCMALQLTACSGGSNSSSTDADSVAGTETSNSEVDISTNETNGERVNMKIGYAYDTAFKYKGGETAENNTWTQLYAENGIDLEIMFNVEATQKDEKIAQLIMSGDYPDFMNVGTSYYKDYATQGVFVDLTDYFDKYASDLTKEYYATDYGKDALESATIDGRFYAMPVASAGYDGLPVLWIRKDWLDNLGLKEPKTVDEFVEIARAFTEDDPDGDGQDNTYGLTVNGKEVFHTSGGVDGFFQMFGAVLGTQKKNIPFIEQDGKAVYGGAADENVQAALTVFNDMYEKKYFAQDFVTSGEEQVFTALSSGKAGMVFGAMFMIGTPWKNALETQPGAEFVAVPLPGVSESEWGQAYYTAVPGGYYVLNSKYQDDEAYIEAYFKIINLGIQYTAQPDTISKEDHEKLNGKDDAYTGWQCALAVFSNPIKNLEALEKQQTALKTGDTSGLNAENLRDFKTMNVYIENADRRDELSEEELVLFEGGLFYWSVWGMEQCSYKAIADMIDNDNLLQSTYNIAPTDNMVEYSTTLTTLAQETIIDIITGNKEVGYYTEYLKLWNSLGGETIIVEADEWFQSTK